MGACQSGPYSETLQKIHAVTRKRLFILASVTSSFEGISTAGIGAISRYTEVLANLDDRYSKIDVFDPGMSSSVKWIGENLNSTPAFKLLIHALQDQVLVPFRAYGEAYTARYGQIESDLSEAHKTYCSANDEYVTSYKAYLDICERLNAAGDSQSAAVDPAMDALRSECTQTERECIAQCEMLGQAKREYALVAERAILLFEAMEKEFFENIRTYSVKFGVVCEQFGKWFSEAAARASETVPTGEKFAHSRSQSQIADRARQIPELTVNVFEFLKGETVLAPIVARLRVAKGTIAPEWREFVHAEKGDFIFIIEERGKDVYVRNEMTGLYGLIAVAELLEIPNPGKKYIRKVAATVTIDSAVLKKGTYVIALPTKTDDGLLRIHTAVHDLVVVPKSLLKKI